MTYMLCILFVCGYDSITIYLTYISHFTYYPANTPRGYHVEKMWRLRESGSDVA